MDFVKMQGLGNDFVVFDGPAVMAAETVVAVCDRRFGIGADGVLVVSPIERDRVRMDYWNADGSPAEMCGNGLRCVARRASDIGLIGTSRFVVETPAGPRRVELFEEGLVAAEIGSPQLVGWHEVEGFAFSLVDVGNPHAVAEVADPSRLDVPELGAKVGTDPVFPAGSNVEFATLEGPDRVRMRVWERGVGETLACGSGMVAAAHAMRAAHGLGDEISVAVPGGTGTVRFADETAWLAGPATTVFTGTWVL